MHVHPLFQNNLDEVPWLVLYQLVSVNYGDFASAQDAEAFGAAALGLDPDEYYAAVCRMADRLETGPDKLPGVAGTVQPNAQLSGRQTAVK
jgi:hypothetical protein